MHGFFAGGAAGCRKKFTKKILFSLNAAKNVRYHGKKNHGQREPRPAPERMIFVAQTTKRALEASLKKLLLHKPLNKITINDITEDCGVNRMTFYYHFKDIYDLVDWVLARDAAKVMEGHRTFDTWHEAFLNIMMEVQQNKTLVLNVYRSMSREQIEVYLYRLLDSMLQEFAARARQGMAVRPDDQQFVVDFYKYALVGIMLEWIRKDMKEDPARITAQLDRMMRGDLRRALKRFSTDAPIETLQDEN